MLALFLAALLGLAQPAARPADPPSRPTAHAERLEGSVTLDGVLDEPAWQRARPATGFTQLQPSPGAPATQRTEAYVLYDDTAIYIGFRCYDEEPERIVRRLTRRDQFVPSDRVFVWLDSDGDGRTAFAFGVNAAGVRYDLLAYDDVREDISWDAVWDAAVAEMPEGGWSVEIRIPLSQLRFASGDGPQSWNVQFLRDIGRSDERHFWSPFTDESPGFVSRFGRLDGLRDLRAPRGLELVPYVAASLDRAPGEAANPFYDANAIGGRLGLDVRYGLSSRMTLSATVNPDFGQVEADPAQVNLTAFESFFEERRPFFVEGADVFRFGQTRASTAMYRPTFFYSRRIGRTPRFGGPMDDENAAFAEALTPTPIAGAAKLSGRAGPWSVGVLSALTLGQERDFVREDGTRGTAAIEPAAHYGVARVRRDFREGASTVGALLTSAERSVSPLLADVMPGRAVVVGLDAEHAFADRSWVLGAVVAGSRVQGDAAFIEALQRAPQRYYQRPDADHLTLDPTRTHLAGGYAELSLANTRGKLRGSVTLNTVTPGFDANELGFQQRADGYGLSGIVFYNEQETGISWLRRYSANIVLSTSINGAGDVLNRQVSGNVNFNLSNHWGGGLYMVLSPTRIYSDRLTRGGPLAERPPDVGVNPWFYTDSRKRVAFEYGGFFRTRLADGPGGLAEHSVSLTFRPTDAVQLSLAPSLVSVREPEQFVASREDAAASATFGRRYVFAELTQQTAALALRANWAFSPTLTLQTYAQPFVSAGRFRDFKQLDAPRSADYSVFGQDAGAIRLDDGRYTVEPGDGGAVFSFDDPDFRVRSLRGGATLRWEYRPGSALFVVWQQQRSGHAEDGTFALGRDTADLFRDAPHNVFLVKLSTWISR